MTLYNLRDKIDDIRKVGMNHHLLSPNSIAALEKLRQRNKILNKSELNALRNLFRRMEDIGFKFGVQKDAQER